MAPSRTLRISKRGTVTLPADLRRSYGMEEDTRVVIEPREEGLLLRTVEAESTEQYSDEQKAAFLLSNAVDEADYQQAREAVRALGLDPDAVEHARP